VPPLPHTPNTEVVQWCQEMESGLQGLTPMYGTGGLAQRLPWQAAALYTQANDPRDSGWPKNTFGSVLGLTSGTTTRFGHAEGTAACCARTTTRDLPWRPAWQAARRVVGRVCACMMGGWAQRTASRCWQDRAIDPLALRSVNQKQCWGRESLHL
jgi:hypothetical protein